MFKKFFLAFFLAFFFVSVPSKSSPEYTVIKRDLGGPILEKASQIYASKKPYAVLKGGVCASACTLIFSRPDTCVHKEARIIFHSPRGLGGTELLDSDYKFYVSFMSLSYPPKVAKIFLERAEKSKNFQFELSGADMIKAGVKEC
jgi:hypothetical protein